MPRSLPGRGSSWDVCLEGHTGHVLADSPSPSPAPQPIIPGSAAAFAALPVAAGRVWPTALLPAWSLSLAFSALSFGEIRIVSPSSLPRAKSPIINEANPSPLWAGLGSICLADTSGSLDKEGASGLSCFHFQASPYLLPTSPTHIRGAAYKCVQNYLITL